MAEYLKKAKQTAETNHADTQVTVENLLAEVRDGGEAKVLELAKRFDNWDGPIEATKDQISAAGNRLSRQEIEDIGFAHENVKKFAEAQRASTNDFELEIIPGLVAGQKQIPVNAAGCYAPGGRYSHIASAMMTTTTAKVAGVRDITGCSPPAPVKGMSDAMLYTFNLCGADRIWNLGGVQAIAAMANGYFGAMPADIIVGPGNQFVAEAKRILFGPVGIDMIAGPTDSLILTDETADPIMVAVDLVGQAEHGYNSPVWLVTTDRAQAQEVIRLVPELIADLPELNAKNAALAWRNLGEVIVCEDRHEAAAISDKYAPEHLSVQAADLEWWLERLTCYGSLFLGEETTVAYGDKVSGPNHVLPTSSAAKYTGGLSVHKYMKTVTWQRATPEASVILGGAAARISRMEGMEGHARTGDIRVKRYRV